MPDSVDRELQIVYGGVTIGGPGNTRFQLHDRFQHERRKDEATLRFNVFVKETSEAAFAQSCALLERQFSTPFLAASVSLGGQNLIVYAMPPQHEVRPSIRKSAEKADTGRTRLYECTLEVSRDADYLTPTGLRESTVDVQYNSARVRTVRIAGTFTGQGAGVTARNRYDAAISAYTTSVLDGLGLTAAKRDLFEEPTARETETGHVLEFEQVWRELIYSQAGATFDDPEITDQVYRATIVDMNPGDSARSPSPGTAGGGTGSAPPRNVRRLQRFLIHYEATLDATLTTSIRTKYESDVRPWILQQVQGLEAARSIGIIRESVVAERGHPNRMVVDLEIVSATKGQDIVEREITLSTSEDPGQFLDPVWNGQPYARHEYQGPATLRRTVTERTVRLTERVTEADLRKDAKQFAAAMEGTEGVEGADQNKGEWTRGEIDTSLRPIRWGPEDNKLEAWEGTWSIVREYFERVTASKPAPSSGGGSTGRTQLGTQDVSRSGAPADR